MALLEQRLETHETLWMQLMLSSEHLEADPKLTDSMGRARSSIDEFVGLGRDGLHAFLHDLPSCDVDYELHRIRHDNPQLPRKLGDLDDLAFLSFALVYCDLVVTQRFWKDRVCRTGLDQRYNVEVLSDLEDLIPILMETTP